MNRHELKIYDGWAFAGMKDDFFEKPMAFVPCAITSASGFSKNESFFHFLLNRIEVNNDSIQVTDPVGS